MALHLEIALAVARVDPDFGGRLLSALYVRT